MIAPIIIIKKKKKNLSAYLEFEAKAPAHFANVREDIESDKIPFLAHVRRGGGDVEANRPFGRVVNGLGRGRDGRFCRSRRLSNARK